MSRNQPNSEKWSSCERIQSKAEHAFYTNDQSPTTVFFNLFAAAELFANVCVAHGTLRNDPSVYLTFCNKRISSQAISTEPSGSAEPRLKKLSLTV